MLSLVIFVTVYLTADVMTVKKIYQAELYLVKLRGFSSLARKCLHILKNNKDMHPVDAREGKLWVLAKVNLYTYLKNY